MIKATQIKLLPTSYVIGWLFALLTVMPGARATDMQWWSTSSPNAVPNGAITLKNASGTSHTIASNPTGANLSTRTANTQPPTVIVQATAALPIKGIGDICTQTTYNSTATEGTAITSDRIMLLTCNAATGRWLPSRAYANEGDACNVIYKKNTFLLADKLTLTAVLPDGWQATNPSGLTLSCQSGVWHGPGFGYGQTWQNLTGSSIGCSGPRTFGVTCTNTSGKPILVSVSIAGGGTVQAWFQINGIRMQAVDAAPGYLGTIIPPGTQYMVENGGATLLYWLELR